MKQIITIFFLLTFVPILFSADIKTLDGTVYKNAQVVNTMPDGILVSFVGDNDFDTVKLVKFDNLPDNLQKKYGYDSKKASLYEKEHQEWLKRQQKIVKEKNTKVKKNDINKENSTRMFAGINTGEADTSLDGVEKATSSSQDKAKLKNLMKRLDSSGANQSNLTNETSIDGLVHDMVSSTEEQVKEINKLTSDNNTE